jgi:hypothetical protein
MRYYLLVAALSIVMASGAAADTRRCKQNDNGRTACAGAKGYAKSAAKRRGISPADAERNDRALQLNAIQSGPTRR